MPPRFDLTLAVTAERMLLHGKHTTEELYHEVWGPTQAVLNELALSQPSVVVCFAGTVYSYGGRAGQGANVYLIDHQRRVVYLATALNTAAANAAWRVFMEMARDDPVTRSKLTRQGTGAITRESFMCTLPVKADILSPPVLEVVVSRYVATFAPRLAHVPRRWLSAERAFQLEQRIREQAKQPAQPQRRKRRKKE